MSENGGMSHKGGMNSSQLYNIASQSSASSGSTMLSMDNQLKDFKKKITENYEPRNMKIIKRVMLFLLLFVTMTTSIGFYCINRDLQNSYYYLRHLHDHVKLATKLMAVENNFRSQLLIANGFYNGGSGGLNMTAQERLNHIVDVNQEYIESIRDINALISQ